MSGMKRKPHFGGGAMENDDAYQERKAQLEREQREQLAERAQEKRDWGLVILIVLVGFAIVTLVSGAVLGL